MPVPKATFTRGTSYLESEPNRARIDALLAPSTSLGDVLRELVDIGLKVKEGTHKLVPIDKES